MSHGQDMLTTFKDDPDLRKKVITGDESWVHNYDIGSKAQLFQWKHFATIEEIKENSKQQLLAITKCAFQKCFED